MVIENLNKTLTETIKKYGINSIEAYHISVMLAIQTQSLYNNKSLQNYYNKSINALVEYLSINETNPNEVKWNRKKKKKGYLSSESIGYMYGNGFHILCKRIRKKLKKLNKAEKL